MKIEFVKYEIVKNAELLEVIDGDLMGNNCIYRDEEILGSLEIDDNFLKAGNYVVICRSLGMIEGEMIFISDAGMINIIGNVDGLFENK